MLCTYALYTTRCRTTGTTLQYQRIPGKVWLYHEGGVRHWHSTVLRPLFRADAQRIYEAQHGEELREQPFEPGGSSRCGLHLELVHIDRSIGSATIDRWVVEALQAQPRLPVPQHCSTALLVHQCVNEGTHLAPNFARTKSQM